MSRLDRTMLDLAARAAARGAGQVEPNPMVGCVIGTPGGRVLGIGHHTRFGAAHAEVEALAACRRHGHDPRGATAWVTLEPCDHFGKTPPCSRALIDAGVARVVIARRDPHPVSAGGIARLRAAGIDVVESSASIHATRLSDPFVTTVLRRRPWVVAKWAQTIDGRIATAGGISQWISGPRARRLVHRWRGRTDVIITGIGTVLADDPQLTCRGVPARRTARRVIVDSGLRVPMTAAVLRTAADAPLIIATTASAARTNVACMQAVESAGAAVWSLPEDGGGRVDLAALMARLWTEHQAASVLVEAGTGLLGGLFAANLVDEARVFVGPRMLGDRDAMPPAHWHSAASLDAARDMDLVHVGRVGPDALMIYRRPLSAVTS